MILHKFTLFACLVLSLVSWSLIAMEKKELAARTDQTILHRLVSGAFASVPNEKVVRQMDIMPNIETYVNAPDNEGNRPIHLALWRAYPEIIEKLIVLDASVLYKNHKGESPLHIATRLHNGDQQTVTLLLENGAYPDAQDHEGRSPLHWAAFFGDKENAKILLAYKAQLDVWDSNHNSPLHYAAKEGQLHLVEFLINQGALKDQKNKDGKTPRMLAHEKIDQLFGVKQSNHIQHSLLVASTSASTHEPLFSKSPPPVEYPGKQEAPIQQVQAPEQPHMQLTELLMRSADRCATCVQNFDFSPGHAVTESSYLVGRATLNSFAILGVIKMCEMLVQAFV